MRTSPQCAPCHPKATQFPFPLPPCPLCPPSPHLGQAPEELDGEEDAEGDEALTGTISLGESTTSSLRAPKPMPPPPPEPEPEPEPVAVAPKKEMPRLLHFREPTLRRIRRGL